MSSSVDATGGFAIIDHDFQVPLVVRELISLRNDLCKVMKSPCRWEVGSLANSGATRLIYHLLLDPRLTLVPEAALELRGKVKDKKH